VAFRISPYTAENDHLARGRAWRTKSDDTRERSRGPIQRLASSVPPNLDHDVAEEAGLARATVTFIGGGKEDLFVAGLERFNVHSRNLAETAAANKGSAAERMHATVMAQYGATSDIVHATAAAMSFLSNLQLAVS